MVNLQLIDNDTGNEITQEDWEGLGNELKIHYFLQYILKSEVRDINKNLQELKGKARKKYQERTKELLQTHQWLKDTWTKINQHYETIYTPDELIGNDPYNNMSPIDREIYQLQNENFVRRLTRIVELICLD